MLIGNYQQYNKVSKFLFSMTTMEIEPKKTFTWQSQIYLLIYFKILRGGFLAKSSCPLGPVVPSLVTNVEERNIVKMNIK
jgi:hypothetical protein